jgi:uncharacterized membrane protein (GlpM family)
VTVLVLKLALTPGLIAGASLAGRRWGGAVSGWLVGLPLTSGPIAVIFAVEHGPHFAAHGAVGSLSGASAEAAFCLAYGWSGRRGWWVGLAAATAAFGAAGAVAQSLPLGPGLPVPLLPLYGAALAALALVVRLLPRLEPRDGARLAPPRWDLPARAIVATALVVLFTGLASTLGARLTGLLAVFPVYAAVLAVFAHRQEGQAGALAVLRGLVFGLLSFATFFFVLAALLGRIDSVAAFACATLAALGVQATSFRRLRPSTV